jgi:hypothetical protein
MILYTSLINQGNGILAVNGQSFQFAIDGTFYAPLGVSAGSASLRPDGNISGSAWQGGNIAQHIENRASAFAGNAQSAAINACVTDTRMAGNIEVATNMNQTETTELHNSAYVLTRMSRNGQGQFRVLFGSRMPQNYIANKGGWYPAYNY